MRAVSSIVCAVLALVGCTSVDTTLERERVAEVVRIVTLTDVDGPDRATSKDVEYWTATGLADGDTAMVMADVRSELASAGFDVGESSARPNDGLVMGAWRDDVAVQVAVYARVGQRPAPPGSRWVQLAVAPQGAGLAWASPAPTGNG